MGPNWSRNHCVIARQLQYIYLKKNKNKKLNVENNAGSLE